MAFILWLSHNYIFTSSFSTIQWLAIDQQNSDLNWKLQQLDWFSLCESTTDINETYSCWYSHLRSIVEKYIPLKTVSIYVLMINLGLIVKCASQLRGGTGCCEFIIIRQSPITWERYQAQRNIVTSLIRFAKKIHYI